MLAVKDKIMEISNTALPLNVKSAQLALNNIKVVKSSPLTFFDQ